MFCIDRDALICDLAETYHVLDYKAVPIMTLATLCAGLHDDSRIKTRMMGITRIAPSFALVRAADLLAIINYSLAAEKGAEKPTLYQDIMMGKQQKKTTSGFASIEEFEEARKRILNNG